jgi:TPR repeat protein
MPLTLALALTFSAGTLVAQDFDKGLAAYDSGDFATALVEWMPLAEQGDAVAQEKLGLMYGAGRGVPQDYADASLLMQSDVASILHSA